MIRLENIYIRVGNFRVENISFEVPTGGYCALMGKTGCGKTTVLESICGLKPVSKGRIFLMDREITRERAANRGVGFVPQDLALFPTMTIREHLAFALTIRKADGKTIARRVDELAELLGLGDLLDRKPAGLSGGESQRVALGRALSASPDILCLDEPLSALDDETREEMFGLLKRVKQETRVTTLHITHNMSETNTLADMLLRMEDGRMVQTDNGG